MRAYYNITEVEDFLIDIYWYIIKQTKFKKWLLINCDFVKCDETIMYDVSTFAIFMITFTLILLINVILFCF